jgi:hypothetical protein
MIGGWEAQEKLPASNPQGFFGAKLVEKLRPLYLTSASSPFPRVGGAHDNAERKR